MQRKATTRAGPGMYATDTDTNNTDTTDTDTNNTDTTNTDTKNTDTTNTDTCSVFKC